jgi:hypothetical protein
MSAILKATKNNITGSKSKRNFMEGLIVYESELNFNEAELMQYLNPVGAGPSSKTCPR